MSGQTLPVQVMGVDAGYARLRVGPAASAGELGPGRARRGSHAQRLRSKGRDRDTALLLSVPQADAGGKRRGLRVWLVGTPVAKGELYRWLKLEWPARGSWEKEPADARRRSTQGLRRAAAAISGLDRIEERRWRRMEEASARTVEGDDPGPASPRLSLRRPCRSSSCCTFGRTVRSRHTGPWRGA